MGSEVDDGEESDVLAALANNPVLNALRRYRETAGTTYMAPSILQPISEVSDVGHDPYRSAKADWEKQLRAHLVKEGVHPSKHDELMNDNQFLLGRLGQCGGFGRSEMVSELQSELVFGQLEREIANLGRCGPVSEFPSDLHSQLPVPRRQLASQLAEGAALQDLVAGRCGIIEDSVYQSQLTQLRASQLQSTFLIDDGVKDVQCGGVAPLGELFSWLTGWMDPATKRALGVGKMPMCGGGSTISSYAGSTFGSGVNTQPPRGGGGGGGAAGGAKATKGKGPGALDLPVHPRMQQHNAAPEPALPIQDNGLMYADIARNGLASVALEQVREAVPIAGTGPGLGRVVCARMLSPRLGQQKFGLSWISELRLSKEPPPEKVQALDQILKEWSQCLKWPSLCQPLGVMAAKLEAGVPGIWFAWAEPLSSHGQVIAAGQKPTDAVSLLEALKVFPPLGLEWRVHVARKLCETLAALHAAGHSHGTLAPRAVWVSAMGEVSITEAGLSDGLLDSGIYHRDELLAHLGLEYARYLAPEGWKYAPGANIVESGMHKDIWALGLILLELLAGVEPVNGECTSLSQLSAKVQKPPVIPRPGADAWLKDVPRARGAIHRCLSMKPIERPEAQEILMSLVLLPPELQPPPAEQQPPPQQTSPPPVAQPPAPLTAQQDAAGLGARPPAPAPARTALSEASRQTSISFAAPITAAGHH
mmetsp:Transcript_58810/g.140207  ORF Transcript_58810/g.140207 Transcript_58810/m.140207 type:complete len:705 (-) Transcript_58810:12-2126(-)